MSHGGLRICAYKYCEVEFEPTDSRQIFCGVTCRANQHYVDHPEKGRPIPRDPLQSVATHPLAEARAEQEASEPNDRLSQVVYNAIVDRLKRGGPVHADDLEPYFPAEHVERCRMLTGAQFGSLASRRYITEVGRRKSSVPARKGAKSTEWQFTLKGRQKLVGVAGNSHCLPAGFPGEDGGDRSGPPVTSDPGEQSRPQTSTDVASSLETEGERPTARRGVGVESESDSPADAPSLPAAGESLALFDPPSERPLSAFTDAEAA